jgi:hypothetical protein
LDDVANLLQEMDEAKVHQVGGLCKLYNSAVKTHERLFVQYIQLKAHGFNP